MFQRSLLPLALLFTSAFAITETFDTYPSTLGAAGAAPVPPTNGLAYGDTFRYTTPGGALGTPVAGVRPRSGINVGLIIRPAVGSISPSPENGGCVRLRQLYFGCSSTNLEGAANIPLECNVTVEAFNSAGASIGKQQLEYEPNNLVLADMAQGIITLPAAARIQISASILTPTVAYLTSLPYPPTFLTNLLAAIAQLQGPVITAGQFDDLQYDLLGAQACAGTRG